MGKEEKKEERQHDLLVDPFIKQLQARKFDKIRLPSPFLSPFPSPLSHPDDALVSFLISTFLSKFSSSFSSMMRTTSKGLHRQPESQTAFHTSFPSQRLSTQIDSKSISQKKQIHTVCTELLFLFSFMQFCVFQFPFRSFLLWFRNGKTGRRGRGEDEDGERIRMEGR